MPPYRPAGPHVGPHYQEVNPLNNNNNNSKKNLTLIKYGFGRSGYTRAPHTCMAVIIIDGWTYGRMVGWMDGWKHVCGHLETGKNDQPFNSPILLVVQFCYRYFKYLWSSQEWWNVVVFFFFFFLVRDAMLSTVHHFWMITLLVDIIGLIFLLLLLLYEMLLSVVN